MKLIQKIIRKFLLLYVLSFAFNAQAQTIHSAIINLKWKPHAIKTETSGGLMQQYLCFDGADLRGEYLRMIPAYVYKKEVTGDWNYSAKMINAQTISVDNIYPKTAVADDFKVDIQIGEERGKHFLLATIIPLRTNKLGKLDELTQFELEFTPTVANKFYTASTARKKTVAHSVLASGKWFQLSTTADGVYQIDANQLQAMGLNISSFDPQNIRMFSMGNGNVPELNSISRPDDLEEMAIQVVGESDHQFNANDYILFYGQQADKLFYDGNGNYHHEKNLYCSKTYYYLTVDLGAGKRIATQASSGSANKTVSSFDDYEYVDNDGINLAHTGREWFDANDFESSASHSYNFSFPNIVTADNVIYKTLCAAQSVANATSMSVLVNGNQLTTLNFGGYTPGYDQPIGTTDSKSGSMIVSSGNLNVQMNYYNPNPGLAANSWLDYFVLQARRNLTMNGSQMKFVDSKSVGVGNISNFVLSNFNAGNVWDILNPLQPVLQQGLQSGSQFSFTLRTDTLHWFVAFNGGYQTPTYEGTVANQDIHGQIVNAPEFIIVTHPDFLSAANTLANFHQTTLNQKTLVVTTTQVYQEFGGGKPDPGAIRDMLRTFYKAAGTDTSKMPKYLLLIGDGSYDNRNIITGNTAFIPTYESSSSIDQATSYTSDDFYAMLDDNEGSAIETGTQLLDISVGRFPVTTITEANIVVDKILHYKSSASFGNWQNLLTFVADDEDQNTHLNQAEGYTTFINSHHPEMNIDKIYLDAYKQIELSSGARYPDVTDAIVRRLTSGTFVMNYTGHGSVIGWAHERIFETPQIQDLTNYDKLPLFITATCEFSMFDQPDVVTAGEHLLIDDGGGAIALFTTSRLVYTGGNQQMNQDIYNYFFNKDANGNHFTLGEVFRLGKNATAPIDNNRKFALLGDPALTLNFPEMKINNLKINNHTISNDTLKAFGKYTINGQVTDKAGNLLSNFNGIVYPTIFDKPEIVTTLGNDPDSYVTSFQLQKNAIYRGKASVKNGLFHYTFIVPKDIAYNVGKGKFSYFANDNITTAMGYDGSVNVGGIADSTIRDKQGPVISIYMNDFKFANGGTTDANPTLLVKLSDASGINTTGTSIGHDLTATIDNDDKNKQVMNDFYQSDLDDYQKGAVSFPLKNLTAGQHTLKVKAWDVINNSNEKEIQFTVTTTKEMALTHVMNYPNPFTTHTTFFFEHNMPGQLLDVHITIYTISGKAVKSIRQQVMTDGYISRNDITWDGTDEFGDKLARGVYIYKLSIKNSNGLSKSTMQKLVIL